MSRKIDMTGRKYGRLTVLRECGRKHGEVLWECVCGCGNIVRVPGFDLRSGNTQSCGCYKNEREREANTKHGCKNTRLYHIWKGIGYRSRSAKDKDYGEGVLKDARNGMIFQILGNGHCKVDITTH